MKTLANGSTMAGLGNLTGAQDLGGTFGISRMTGFNAPGPRAGGCRFPMWGDGPPTHKYCGKKPVAPGEPYCPAHHARCHQKTPPLLVPG